MSLALEQQYVELTTTNTPSKTTYLELSVFDVPFSLERSGRLWLSGDPFWVRMDLVLMGKLGTWLLTFRFTCEVGEDWPGWRGLARLARLEVHP